MTTLRLITPDTPTRSSRRFHAIGARIIDDWAVELSPATILRRLSEWEAGHRLARDAGDYPRAALYVDASRDLNQALEAAQRWARMVGPENRRSA